MEEQRGNLLAIQKELVEVINAFSETIFSTPEVEWTLGVARVRMEMLESYWMDFQSNHLGLMSANEEDGYDRASIYKSVERNYIKGKAKIYDVRSQLMEGGSVQSMDYSKGTERQAHSHARLPRINVPEFSGRREEWESFRDLFKALIHNDDNLNNVEKLYYLKTLVKGEAQSALDAIQLTGDNYSIAWGILEDRFEHRRLLVYGHLNALRSIKPIREESTGMLQTLLDTLRCHRDQLKTLNCPVDEWDAWLVSIAASVMDPITRRAWRTFEELSKFLSSRCRSTGACSSSDLATSRPKPAPSGLRGSRTYATRFAPTSCAQCKAEHYTGRCAEFMKQEPRERRNKAVQARLCFNCLRPGHAVRSCPPQSTCQQCRASHHTLLHEAGDKRPGSGQDSEIPRKMLKVTAATRVESTDSTDRDPPSFSQPPIETRALLDACSELTLVSAEVVRRLKATTEKTNNCIIGVGGDVVQRSTRTAQLHLHLPDHSSPVEFTAVCFRRLGIITPAVHIDDDDLVLWKDRRLADPKFGIPRPIELLLGADLLPELMKPGSMQSGDLLAQNTAVGWTISGRVSKKHVNSKGKCLLSLNEVVDPPWHRQLNESIQRFWEMEDVPPIQSKSKLHEACEKIFAEHRRDPGGKYIVRLSLKDDAISKLGNSEASARATLARLHRRMKRDARFAAAYRKFMSDYLTLGHMRVITEEELRRTDRIVNYIPHQGIWQHSDDGDRLRVVFDASRPTSSGWSLNDMLHCGPKLQTEVWVVLLRWRTRRVGFATDVQMMFRGIWLDEKDVDLQRILWSPSEEEPVRHIQLLTVTYGTSCAPYLSLRTIQQLCNDEGKDYPEAREALLKDRYVDDILTGAHEVEDALRLQDHLIKLMKAGGFRLRKWVSNHPELLRNLDASDCLRPTWISFSADNPVRELGIAWCPQEDTLGLGRPCTVEDQQSKRRILSSLASIFDPCGWLAPATLMLKLLIQDLWSAGLDWDEPLPSSMSRRWESTCESFAAFDEISLPRWISTGPTANNTAIHVFSDASRRAMASVVYSRTSTSVDTGVVNLLVAKTKLAPIRSLRPSEKKVPRMTIPRLELRAALIGARLLHRVCTELEIPPHLCCAWSDSQIVLHWILSKEPTGNSIVDSYVHQIQELSPTTFWRYVPSELNPADVASRGADVRQLLHENCWFSGPTWLASPASQWPCDQQDGQTYRFDENDQSIVLACTANQERTDYISKFSDLGRLLRFLTRLRRWVRQRLNRESTAEILDPITPTEIHTGLESCIRFAQRETFNSEINLLKQMQLDGRSDPLPRGPLRTLAPLVCPSGILRVGGRLEHSSLPYHVKHPPILDGACHLAELIIDWAHARSLHGGFRSTYSYVLQRAWVLGGKRRIRHFISKCVVCVRHRSSPATQLMANLPPGRVTPSRAFARTGVDYAGPFHVLPRKGQGVRTKKIYVAAFVCMASKNIHLEPVGDLSTESLMGAVTRFCGRRGRPAEFWSDNATNFHRADIELKEALHQESLNWDQVTTRLAEEGISWNFIPPSAPHFGGLWEAAVRSFKTHLKKRIGSRHLTYEEFTTLLVSIEVVLNSRPLGPISGDIDDLRTCTPGHLLLGDSLLTIPDMDHLQHWQLVKAMRAKFWQQWSREYLNTLQQRHKWIHPRDNIQVGSLALILDASLLRANGRWPLGRLIAVHPGRDGLVRTATVKTEHGVYVRPIVKLTVLPITEEPASAPPTKQP